MGDEVALSRVGRGSSVAGAGADPTKLYESGYPDIARTCQQGSCAYLGVKSAELESREDHAVREREIVADVAG